MLTDALHSVTRTSPSAGTPGDRKATRRQLVRPSSMSHRTKQSPLSIGQAGFSFEGFFGGFFLGACRRVNSCRDCASTHRQGPGIFDRRGAPPNGAQPSRYAPPALRRPPASTAAEPCRSGCTGRRAARERNASRCCAGSGSGGSHCIGSR